MNSDNRKFPKNNSEDGFITSIEAFLLARRIQELTKTKNKIDKNLASMLLELVETISGFLDTATFDDDDETVNNNINEIIPVIEDNILQAHRMFFCAVCNKNIKASGVGIYNHFINEGTHLKLLRNYVKTSDNQSTVSSSSDMNLTNNHETKSKEIKKKPPAKESSDNNGLPKKVRELFTKTDITKFSQTLVREGQAIKMNPQYNHVCQMLQKHLQYRYPKVKVYAFGSVFNGIGNEKSDLDIFVDTENCFYNRLSKRKMKDVIYQVQRILSSHVPYNWDNFEPVVHARTPILRAFCVAEQIDCDLSFSNGLSTCNTTLIQYFIELQPISKQIIVFVKFWASQLQIGVNSYLLTLMVIFYMQQESLFPSVKTLQEPTKEVLIDGWNANYVKIGLAQLKIPLATDFRKYLIGFYKFYGFDFDYKSYIICVLTGTRVPKQIFDHGKESQLPPVFSKFVEYMDKINVEEADEVDELFSNHKPMVIQDPFELIHNVSKGVQESKLNKIINYLRSTYELLLGAKF